MVAEPEYDLIGLRPSDLSEDDLKRAATILGGLVLGQAAEAAFEDIYRSEMGQEVDFKLVDLREGRSDTDYRVLNFPLATYKILLRQGAGRAVAPERVATLPPGGCVLLGQTVCAGLPNSALCVIIPCNLTTPDCCSHTPK